MDPVENPYSPGAGSPPPELAGRDRIREQVRVAIARIRVGNAAKSVLMVGLRGVGKTVLLDQMRSDAERTGIPPAYCGRTTQSMNVRSSDVTRTRSAEGPGISITPASPVCLPLRNVTLNEPLTNSNAERRG